MSAPKSLYEFLSVEIEGSAVGGYTVVTETDDEEYDEDGSLSRIDSGISLAGIETSLTKVDGETYDDNPGVDGMAVPMSLTETTITATASETYDDKTFSDSFDIPQS